MLGLFISNTATAVPMAPISLTDEHAGVGPGPYSFGDYVRVGVPFTIIVAIVSVLLVPIFLPFQ